MPLFVALVAVPPIVSALAVAATAGSAAAASNSYLDFRRSRVVLAGLPTVIDDGNLEPVVGVVGVEVGSVGVASVVVVVFVGIFVGVVGVDVGAEADLPRCPIGGAFIRVDEAKGEGGGGDGVVDAAFVEVRLNIDVPADAAAVAPPPPNATSTTPTAGLEERFRRRSSRFFRMESRMRRSSASWSVMITWILPRLSANGTPSRISLSADEAPAPMLLLPAPTLR